MGDYVVDSGDLLGDEDETTITVMPQQESVFSKLIRCCAACIPGISRDEDDPIQSGLLQSKSLPADNDANSLKLNGSKVSSSSKNGSTASNVMVVGGSTRSWDQIADPNKAEDIKWRDAASLRKLFTYVMPRCVLIQTNHGGSGIMMTINFPLAD